MKWFDLIWIVNKKIANLKVIAIFDLILQESCSFDKEEKNSAKYNRSRKLQIFSILFTHWLERFERYAVIADENSEM